MIIAVNTRLNNTQQPEGYENLLFSLLAVLSENHPKHQFIYISDGPYTGNQVFAPNVTQVVAGPKTTSSISLRYWINFKIPAVLRKYKADVFLSLEGICALRTNKPQCLLVTDLRYVQKPVTVQNPLARLQRKSAAAFLKKAACVAAVSENVKTEISQKYGLINEDIPVIPPVLSPHFKPLGWQQKEQVRERVSQGKAYFLYSGSTGVNGNLINLLKAFGFFKRRQKSNMLLLIAGHAHASFKKELQTYKYRHDVLLLEELPVSELAAVTAAAYAVLYPVLYADFALQALQAMQCQVPVICSQVGALPGICADAALYVNPQSHQDIAEKMMLIFKDEDLAGQLALAAKQKAPEYNPDKTAARLMQAVNTCING